MVDFAIVEFDGPQPADVTDRAGRDLGLTNRTSSASRTQVVSSAADTLVIAANPARRGLFLFNNSDSPVHIGLGAATVTLDDSSYILSARSAWEVPFHFTGEVRAIWEVATGELRVTELT